MKFSNEQVLHAPMTQVEKAYFSFDYCPQKYRTLGLSDVQVVSTHREGDDFAICCDFKMQPDIQAPKFAQKFVKGGDMLDVRQTDRWNTATRRGQLVIDIRSFKGFVTIGCDMRLEEHPEGAVNRMDWEVKCSLPLIGGKLEKYLVQDIQNKFDDDCRVANQIIENF